MVQGVIIGATFAFLTTILILDAVAMAEIRTANVWSSIRPEPWSSDTESSYLRIARST